MFLSHGLVYSLLLLYLLASIGYLWKRSTKWDIVASSSAEIGVVGFADVPLVAMAITLWRTQHPSPVIFEGGLTPPMLGTLLVSVAATSLYFVLLLQRVSIKSCLLEINKLKVFFT